MKFVFSESLRDAYRENGEVGILTLWIRTLTDTFTSLILQHVENRKGGETMKSKNTDIIKQNKVFLWIAAATGLILSIPLLAMQFTSEVNWDSTDFIIMGTLLFGMGSLFVVVARLTKRKYRAFIAIGFILAVLYIWAELAVGIFTNWGS